MSGVLPEGSAEVPEGVEHQPAHQGHGVDHALVEAVAVLVDLVADEGEGAEHREGERHLAGEELAPGGDLDQLVDDLPAIERIDRQAVEDPHEQVDRVGRGGELVQQRWIAAAVVEEIVVGAVLEPRDGEVAEAGEDEADRRAGGDDEQFAARQRIARRPAQATEGPQRDGDAEGAEGLRRQPMTELVQDDTENQDHQQYDEFRDIETAAVRRPAVRHVHQQQGAPMHIERNRPELPHIDALALLDHGREDRFARRVSMTDCRPLPLVLRFWRVEADGVCGYGPPCAACGSVRSSPA